MKRRILLLSYYFEPDLSAGSFRAEALVKALLEEGGDDIQIDVVTTLPNRYRSFRARTSRSEKHGALRIRRIAVPTHQGGVIDQTRSFLAYARGVLRITRREHYDLVVATSSRLMTATLGAIVARRQRASLYLDIRDILVDALPELLPKTFGRLATLLFSRIERWTIQKATQVNLISPGFLSYFTSRYPARAFTVHTNGVDDLFLPMVSSEESSAPPGLMQVLYAGNIGEGQGLHHVLPALAKRLEGEAYFRVVGAGSAHGRLARALSRHDVHNVELLPPIKRSDLVSLYQSADVLFLHLNRNRAFRRVLPSKLFEYAATGKPIWAGVSGYPAEFVEQKIINTAIFRPCDVESAVAALRRLNLSSVCRSGFVAIYSRRSIQKEMASDVLGALDQHRSENCLSAKKAP
ncbi:glycosyltransferase family 4 protein [Pseudomonas sp. SCB32]|uniref:glycosyltransferase family 4 protein n=1 Tax=Pseudomonas sp. SCB32 TaxID=2653853 RepID=UPI001264FAE9|nr:glycosyltransferase family 4 protein [Pseudomonas sp. SCB32]